MKVYVATSWRNKLTDAVVMRLRQDGHEVFDFREGGKAFAWSDLDPNGSAEAWSAEEFGRWASDPRAAAGFRRDMDALEAADAVVLVLPCGRSAHLELGHAVGAGKLTYVWMPFPEKPELMYLACDGVHSDLDEEQKERLLKHAIETMTKVEAAGGYRDGEATPLSKAFVAATRDQVFKQMAEIVTSDPRVAAMVKAMVDSVIEKFCSGEGGKAFAEKCAGAIAHNLDKLLRGY